MSQRDLLAELRAASTPAPPALRERVRLLEPPAPRRPRLTWRRALVVALPVAAAVATGIVVATRPAHHSAAVQHGGQALFKAATPAIGAATERAPLPVPPSATRPQRYEASLTLREPDARALSDAVRSATRIAGSLSGYVRSAHVAGGRADLVLVVPRTNVSTAVTRLERLGTIAGASVDVQDLGAGLSATDRTIARLQRRLRELRAQPPTPATRRAIAAAIARVQALQRQEATTRRTAHFATVSLSLVVPHPTAAHAHGPLHALVVALRWTGIGALYALAVGVPLTLLWLAARWVRRRREDRLLSRA